MNNDFVWVVQFGTAIMFASSSLVLVGVVFGHKKMVEQFQSLKKHE